MTEAFNHLIEVQRVYRDQEAAAAFTHHNKDTYTFYFWPDIKR